MAFDQIISQEACRAIASEYQPEDLEDLCQEARVKVYVKREQIAQADDPPTYCRTVIRNAMIDYLRAEARHHHQVPLPTSE